MVCGYFKCRKFDTISCINITKPSCVLRPPSEADDDDDDDDPCGMSSTECSDSLKKLLTLTAPRSTSVRKRLADVGSDAENRNDDDDDNDDHHHDD